MQTQQSITYGPILLAIGTWLFAGSEIYQRAAIEFKGTIVSATTLWMGGESTISQSCFTPVCSSWALPVLRGG